MAAGATLLVIALSVPGCGPRLRGVSLPGASTGSMTALARGQWPTYAGTYASARYSPRHRRIHYLDSSNDPFCRSHPWYVPGIAPLPGLLRTANRSKRRVPLIPFHLPVPSKNLMS